MVSFAGFEPRSSSAVSLAPAGLISSLAEGFVVSGSETIMYTSYPDALARYLMNNRLITVSFNRI